MPSSSTRPGSMARKSSSFVVFLFVRRPALIPLYARGGLHGSNSETHSTRTCRLPGDFGFDPLGLGKDPAFLKWYREAELIHGRWAMAAVLGIFIGQAYSGVPWFEAGAQPGAVAPFSFGSLLGTQLLLMGWVESKRWVDFFNPDSQSVEWATPWSRTAENFANFTGEQGYPGGKFFDPLGLGGETKDGVYIPDTEKLERLKVAEIKHSRLAMLAMLIFYFEAGQGKTPLGALGL
uniref:Chlorophyll a-b binding protein, chloroplastic n=1 Tax=Aegilops tauschii subsp. strangulata TaxID=200361 RepID=A0A453C452_AEGTS